MKQEYIVKSRVYFDLPSSLFKLTMVSCFVISTSLAFKITLTVLLVVVYINYVNYVLSDIHGINVECFLPSVFIIYNGWLSFFLETSLEHSTEGD